MTIANYTKGLLFLWAAILLFAAKNSVISKLGTLGTTHLIHFHNPISFCNVLFVGNLLAGLVFMGLYRKEISLVAIKKIRPKQWGFLSVTTICLAILGPMFYFVALLTTEVINVVLIASTETFWTLLFGYLLFRNKPSMLTLISSFISVLGVMVIFILHQPSGSLIIHKKLAMATYGSGWLTYFGSSFPKGSEILALLGACFTTLGDQLSRKTLNSGISVGILNCFRTFFGAIIFFIIAVHVFGWRHFADLFSPFLWQWMVIYAVMLVALAVYCWNMGLKTVRNDDIAIANAFMPVAGVIFAYLILGEIPDYGQFMGGGIILVGILAGLKNNFFIKRKVPLADYKGP